MTANLAGICGCCCKGERFAVALLGMFCLLLVTPAGTVCPVSVNYEVSLGQQSATAGGSSYATVPIFFGRVGVYSNNVSGFSLPRSNRLHRTFVLTLVLSRL